MNIQIYYMDLTVDCLRMGLISVKFYTSIESNIRPVKHKLKASALQFMYSMDITSDCLDSLFTWFKALQRNELWAYQIFDSMGKIPSGLSDGVITSFGDYDQCLAVKSGPQMNTKTIYGKYCLVKPVIPLNNTDQLMQINGFDILNNETNTWIKSQISTNINKIKPTIILDLNYGHIACDLSGKRFPIERYISTSNPMPNTYGTNEMVTKIWANTQYVGTIDGNGKLELQVFYMDMTATLILSL
ncbi:unnamed protein product [Medioppia subpectinata]|uniref:Nose resistant-to-fluoxetine protein N-terminal domain-containing protein n=1 Tax=Medioppia subpectinata TaxID=1979941 RepID=A0A7R9KJ76_9ACAR|nr:unnamed protein product [Medioppia subpectinata]CAG2103167.1 unnamed protein product [Medioppia subpectinata]